MITPLAVPLLYTLLDDLRITAARAANRVMGRTPAQSGDPETAEA